MTAMAAIDSMTDEQFERHALGILQRELGVYGFARFLRVYHTSTGDYTRDRHRWLGDVSVEELIAELPPNS